MCSLSFLVFDGSTNCILSHFPHTTGLDDLAGYFINREVVAGGGSLVGFLFWVFIVFIPLNLYSGESKRRSLSGHTSEESHWVMDN